MSSEPRSIELAFVVVYLLACVGIALWANRKVRGSQEDYWVAGRQIGVFANSWAMMSALASGGSVMGILGLAYATGIPYVMALFAGAAAGFPLAAILVAKGLHRMKLMTVSDFFSKRYPEAKVLRWLVPLLIVLCMGTYVVAQLKAAGLAAVYVLGVPYEWAVFICALVFIFYVSLGGMWAVTVSDVLQGMLMFAMVCVLGLVVWQHFEGPIALLNNVTLREVEFGRGLEGLHFSSYVGGFVLWLLAACVSPHLVMRVFTAKDSHSARLSLNYAVLLYAVMVLTALFLLAPAGKLLYGNLVDFDPDSVFLHLVDQFLPPVLGGVAVAAVLAAVMSTTDSLLLAASSAITHDIYGKILRPQASQRSLYMVSLASVWVLGLGALFFALEPPLLLTMLYSAAIGLLGATLFVPLVGGLWWRQGNGRGALAAVLSGALVYLWLSWGTALPALSPILFALPVSALAFVGFSLWGVRKEGPAPAVFEALVLSAGERRVLFVLFGVSAMAFLVLASRVGLWGVNLFAYIMAALMLLVPWLMLRLKR